MQYDFIDGSLKVDGAEQIIPSIKSLLKVKKTKVWFDRIHQDDHQRPHFVFIQSSKINCHFQISHTKKVKKTNIVLIVYYGQTHCVVGTKEIKIMKDLKLERCELTEQKL